MEQIKLILKNSRLDETIPDDKVCFELSEAYLELSKLFDTFVGKKTWDFVKTENGVSVWRRISNIKEIALLQDYVCSGQLVVDGHVFDDTHYAPIGDKRISRFWTSGLSTLQETKSAIINPLLALLGERTEWYKFAQIQLQTKIFDTENCINSLIIDVDIADSGLALYLDSLFSEKLTWISKRLRNDFEHRNTKGSVGYSGNKLCYSVRIVLNILNSASGYTAKCITVHPI